MASDEEDLGEYGEDHGAKYFLQEHLAREASELYGVNDHLFIDGVVNRWMNDHETAAARFQLVGKYCGEVKKVLDMACGCGAAAFYGLINGYEMYGIDPQQRKHRFNAMKAGENGYPSEWLQRFALGVGEDLPYPDNFFECVMTQQTLEHVQDVRKCLAEMLRVTRPGGYLLIQCPDYTGTWEGHYLLPWLPLLPRRLAAGYLRLLGRPVKGLEGLNYTTKKRVVRRLRQEAAKSGIEIAVEDIGRRQVEATLGRGGIPAAVVFHGHNALLYLARLFRAETPVRLIVRVNAKDSEQA